MNASKDKTGTDDFLRKLLLIPKGLSTKAFWAENRGSKPFDQQQYL
jgi:hypothetical protein